MHAFLRTSTFCLLSLMLAGTAAFALWDRRASD